MGKKASLSVSPALSAPEARTPDQLPDPWLIDTEYLLKELTRIRVLQLNVPLTTESYQPVNTVIDALWRLEKDLRFLLHLHCERQRSFGVKAATLSSVAISEPRGEGVRLSA